MRLAQKSDRSGKKSNAAYYREKAGSMRELAARTKFPDTREQLLWIAIQYEQLAEHVTDEKEEATPAPASTETAARKE